MGAVLGTVWLLCLTCLLAIAVAAAQVDDLEKVAANPPATGLLLTDVVPGEQAAAAGLAPGDVLVSYGGVKIRSREELFAQLQARAAEAKVPVVYVRLGKEQTADVKGGRLGLNFVSVEKGKAVPRVAETPYTPDYGALKPGETFYALRVQGQKVGFERRVVEVKGDQIVLDHLVRFKLGEFDEDLRMRQTLTRDRYLTPQSVRLATGEMEIVTAERREGGYRGKRGGQQFQAALPPNTMTSYALFLAAQTMPRRVGTCLHLSMLSEGDFTASPAYELVCAARETIRAGGKDVETFRYDVQRFGGVTNRFWIAADGRVVKAHYGGPEAELTTREEALAGLPEGISTRF